MCFYRKTYMFFSITNVRKTYMFFEKTYMFFWKTYMFFWKNIYVFLQKNICFFWKKNPDTNAAQKWFCWYAIGMKLGGPCHHIICSRIYLSLDVSLRIEWFVLYARRYLALVLIKPLSIEAGLNQYIFTLIFLP